MASESRRAQTGSRNTPRVRTTDVTLKRSRNVLGKHTKESESLVSETWKRAVVSRVVQDTRNPVWKSEDHLVRLNTTWWPIVKQYREGKLKRTPGGEWNRTWNLMFTSRQSTLKCDVVLFVERSGELFVWCEVKYYVRYGAEGKPSLKRAKWVSCNRPETEWPIHEQVETRVKSGGGPNWWMLKNSRMTCG